MGDKGRDPRLRVPPVDGHQSTIHIVPTNSEGRHRVSEKTNLLYSPYRDSNGRWLWDCHGTISANFTTLLHVLEGP